MTITVSESTTGTLVADSRNQVNAFAVAIPTSESAASTPATFFDSDVLENLSAETWNEYEIQSELGSSYTVENLSACQSLTGSAVAPVGDGGFGRVKVTNGTVSKILKCDTFKRGGQTFREFIEYTEGSISRYLFDQVAAIFDATPDVDYYSAYNHETSTYTRNAACWAASVDLSCVAVASNDGSGWTRQRGGVLIGEEGEDPEHLLITVHFPYGVGTQVRFADANGNVQTRTVIGTSSAAYAGDLRVCALNAPMTIAPACKIAGSWITQGREVVGTVTYWYSGGLAMHTDQNGKIYAATLGQITSKVYCYSPTFTVGATSFANSELQGALVHDNYAGAIPSEFSAMIHTPIGGDSGQPVFVVVDGEPVLLWTWTSPYGGTPAYLHNGAVLNALIVSANDNAVANGHTRPPDHEVTVAPSPI